MAGPTISKAVGRAFESRSGRSQVAGQHGKAIAGTVFAPRPVPGPCPLAFAGKTPGYRHCSPSAGTIHDIAHKMDTRQVLARMLVLVIE